MRSRRFLVGAMAALVGGLAPAQGPTRGTGLVVVGRIEAVRALELGPCPDDPDRDEGTEARGRVAALTCGSFLVVEVRPQEFLRGARRDRLEIRFPRVPDERELAGAHAVAFLERRGDELWVAEGRAGLVTSAEPFPESGIDRLRTALAVRAAGSEGDASGPPDDAPRTGPFELAGNTPVLDIIAPELVASDRSAVVDPLAKDAA